MFTIAKEMLIVFFIVQTIIDISKQEFKLKKFSVMDVYDGPEMPRVIKATNERK